MPRRATQRPDSVMDSIADRLPDFRDPHPRHVRGQFRRGRATPAAPPRSRPVAQRAGGGSLLRQVERRGCRHRQRRGQIIGFGRR